MTAPVDNTFRNEPEVFASSIAVVGTDGPNLRMTFVRSRPDAANPSNPNTNVVNLQLVMSIPSVQNMVAFLTDYLKRLEQPVIPENATIQ